MCSCIPPGGNEGCALARANVENCDFSSSIPGRGGVNAVICALESEKDFPEEESETERERRCSNQRFFDYWPCARPLSLAPFHARVTIVLRPLSKALFFLSISHPLA